MAVRISLRAKVYAGFGALVVLGLAMAGFGAIGIVGVSASIGIMNMASSNVLKATEANEASEVLHRAENRYRIDRNPAALAAIRNAERKIASAMADVSAAALSTERKQQSAGIGTLLQGVAAATDGFLAAYDMGFAERALLLTGGDNLTAATANLVAAGSGNADVQEAAARVESAMLLVQVANWRFLATMDPVGVATFRTNADQAEAQLTSLEKLLQKEPAMQPALILLPPVREALGSYRVHFENASSALLDGARRFSTDVLPKLGAMQDALAVLLASMRSTFAAASSTASSHADDTVRLQWIVAIAGAAGGLTMAILIARGVVGPIAGMTKVMTRLANGDHQLDVPGCENGDEVGEMARAVEVFRLNAIEAERAAVEKSAEQAARDRRAAAMNDRVAAFGTSVSGVMASLVDAAGTMRASAQEMADAAARTAESTSDAVDGAKASSRDLNFVAAAAEEMASSISEISQQVGHVTSAVQDAVGRATATDQKVAGLAQAAERIGDVIRLITHIAGQTNLLALNATIEAARAGEAGKGFAVVAGEVKALAAATARATDQIGTQIVAIREATGEAVEAVRDVGTAIGKASSVAAAIAAAVEEQAAATQEISNSVQTVTMATANAALSMERVLGIAEHTGASSRGVKTVADNVGATAATLRTEVDDFIAAMARNDDTEHGPGEGVAGIGTQARRRA